MDKTVPNKKSIESPASSKVFKGVRFEVHTLKLPGKTGNLISKDVVIHPGAVMILPLLDKDHLVMIRNRRFAIGKELWELPAGTLEKGESPLETAKREIIEETGYEAGKIDFLTSFYTTPGFCNEIMYAYVASQLNYKGQALEETEEISVEIVTWKKALKMVEERKIEDGKTILGLLFYQTFGMS